MKKARAPLERNPPNTYMDEMVEMAIAAWNTGGFKRPRGWLYEHGGLPIGTFGTMDRRYRDLVVQARAATARNFKPDSDSGAVFPGFFNF